jgi:hypothetical protein
MTLTTSTRATRRARVGAGVLLAGTLVLSGCGSNDSAAGGTSAPASSSAAAAQTPFEVVNAASTTSAEAATANFTLDSTTTAAGQTVTITGQGQLDSSQQAVSLDLTTTGAGTDALTLSQVVVGDTAYLKGVPGQPADQWLSMSLDQFGASGSGSDPSAQLGLLSDVADDVTEAGTEDVNGVEATKYTGTIDLAKAADAAEADGADGAALREQYTALGLTAVPFEVYVDEDGLPVRMVTTISAAVEGQDLESATTVDFSDWGSDVSIVAPEGAVPFDPSAMGAAPAA